MSLGNYIKWCKCKRMILRSYQITTNMCDECEKEHAKTLKKRLEIDNKKNEFNC